MQFIIIIAVMVWCQLGWTETLSELSRAEQMLAEDIRRAPKALINLQQTVRLYHYFKPYVVDNELYTTYQTPEMRNGEHGQTHFDLSHFAGAFWNPNVTNSKYINAGPGLYLAVDPVVSESFGHSYYAIDFPINTKYLDLTDHTWSDISKIKLRSETLQALNQEGIVPLMRRKELGFRKGYFSRIALQYMVNPTHIQFRKSIEKIFRHLGITLIEYSWERSHLKPLCRKVSLSAFVFIGSGPLMAGDQGEVLNRAEIDSSISAVFGSSYFVRDYLFDEQAIINLTQKFKTALQKENINLLTPNEQRELRSLTLNCEGLK